MRKFLFNLIIIFLFCFIGNLTAQETSAVIIGDILNSIHQPSEALMYSEVKRFKKIDFFKLVPSKRVKGGKKGFDVFFDNSGSIVKIRKNADGGFIYDFIVEPNPPMHCEILYLYETSELDNIRLRRVNGVILICRNFIYFIGQKDTDAGSKILKKSSQISCIMLLDENLNPIKTLKFSNASLQYYTLINYNKDSHVTIESFYRPVNTFSISGNTKLDELPFLNIEIRNWVFVEDRQVALFNRFRDLPLWRLEGNHDYFLKLR
ncbi:MAG: hypothetical protein DI539_26275 [Flavobacterium psychrophilum]|nr:MAG: hypothetical protein DI539_26275 [Flavobacterium psychrophilum]